MEGAGARWKADGDGCRVQSRELPLEAEGLGEGCMDACIRGEALGRAGLVIRTGRALPLCT